MPYIGKSPVGGGFHKLDALTASATATYALTLGSAAYYPETANQLLVSLNGVIQAPQDSYTVSGSNLIFDSALTASDSIDFVVALGDVLGVQGVTDGAVTTNKIANGAVNTNKIANGAVTMNKLATSGTLPALDGSALTGIQSATLSSSNPLVTSNGALGDQWNNYITGEVFICIDATTNNNIWEGTKGTTVAPYFMLYDFGTTASGTTWTWNYTSSNSSHNVAFNSDHIRIECVGSAYTGIGISTRLTTVQAFTIPSGFNNMEVTLYTDADNDTVLTRLGTSQYSGNLATFYHNTTAGQQQVFTVDVTAHSGSSVYWGAEANGGQYANVQFRVQRVKFYQGYQTMEQVKILDALSTFGDFRVIGEIALENVTFTDPSISITQEQLETRYGLTELRSKRNLKLAETDWWVLSDRTATQAQLDYRQALRDITETYTSLDDVVWPTKPENV